MADSTKLDGVRTDYFATNRSEAWAALDHPNFYYDPDFTNYVCSRLDALERLEANWDGEGAPIIDRTILLSVRDFVRQLPPHIACRPMVVPLSTGSLQLEWHHGSRVLELEFERPDAVHYLKWNSTTHTNDENLVALSRRDELVDLIRWFMQGVMDA